MPIGGGVLGAMLTRLGCEIVAFGIDEGGTATALPPRPDVVFASVGYGAGRPRETPVVASHRGPLVSYGPAGRQPARGGPAVPSDVHIEEPFRLADVSRALAACLAIDRRASARAEPRAGADVEPAMTAKAFDGLAIEIAAFRRQDCIDEPAECAFLAHRIVSSASILDLRDLTAACMAFGSCWTQGLDLRPAHARVLGAMADAEGSAAGAAGPGTGRRDMLPAAPTAEGRSSPPW